MADVPYPRAMEKFPTLRQSLLSDFDNCALTTKFGLDYRKGWDSHPAGRGKLFHEFAAKALTEMHAHDQGQIEVDVALAILHEVLRQADVDDICHQPLCELPAEVIPEEERAEDGRSLRCAAGHTHHSDVVNVPMREIKDLYWVVKKWAFDNVWDIRNLVSVEERLQTTVFYPDPTGGSVERVITGRTDAQFLDAEDSTRMVLLDWKDSWALPPPTEVSFEGFFQQRFYGLLVLRNYRSIDRITLREFYPRYSEPREATITREMLPDIEMEVAALAERFDRAYESNVWKPTPGKHCSFCPRPTACPIPVFTRGEGRITDEQQAEKIAAQLTVAEVVVKQTRNALRTYASTHGTVPVKDAKGTTVWGFREIERESKPTREQVEQAVAEGRNPADLFKTRKGTKFERFSVRPEEEQAEDDEMLAALKASVGAAQK